MVDELFKRCSEIVVNHDGIVDHFMGDAVMALFNVPIHREDHIAQAISAATQIQMVTSTITDPESDEHPLRVGIGTGLAITGKVGSDSCNNYTALGDVVNVASRVQGEAAAGETIVTEEVYDAVRDAFPNAKERVLELKGIPEPVKAYLLN